MRSLTIRYDEPLPYDIDVEERLRGVPAGARARGMFFDPFVQVLGRDVEAVLPKMVEPPRGGRFIAFTSYPYVDYLRMQYAAARHRSPRSVPEGARQIARRTMETFNSSTVGRVTLAMLADVRSAMAALPKLSTYAFDGFSATTTPIDDRSMRVEVHGFYGQLDCGNIGTLESIATYYGATPEIDLRMDALDRATYVVRWR